MIQFNLLPDVKQQYVKARQLKRLVVLVSFAVSGVSLFVLILLLLTVDVVQKKSLHDLNANIMSKSSQLQKVPDLDKILTVQNQLTTLTGLHDSKPVSSRLFGYMAQVTPNTVTISKLTIDYSANTLSISGEAPSLDLVNTYTDTLKNTTYTTDAPGSQAVNAFSQVVLSTFGRDSKGATYNINLNFDPLIFNSANNVKLAVPSGTTGAQATLFQKEASN